MLFSLLHFVRGYCQVALSGVHQERFLNICAAKQILLWNLHKKESHYIFCISRKACRELAEISEKTGCSFRYLRKKGLPFLFYQYKKRKIFMLTLLLCLCLFYGLSLFLWQIETEGCYSHSKEEMMDYLHQNGICCGKKLSEISCEQLEEKIRKDYKDIAWVSCELKGTLLTVTIKETLSRVPEEEKVPDTPCNLIAAKTGTIDSIVVRKGTGMVKKGDVVKEGDVLISGDVELFDDAGEVMEHLFVRAQGDIFAITKTTYKDTFPLLYYEKKDTGKKSYRFQVAFCEKIYSLPMWGERYKNQEEETREIPIHIGPQLYLPISLYVTTFSECRILEKQYTKAEAKKEAKERLLFFLAEHEAKGVDILKNNVKIDCDEKECIAKGTLLFRERFGKIQERNADESSKKVKRGAQE